VAVVSSTTASVLEEGKAAEEAIRSAMNAIRSEVDQREAQLISEMLTLKEQKLKQLALQKEELEFTVSGIRHATQFVEVVLKKGTGVEVSLAKKGVLARLGTLESDQCQFIPTTSHVVDFFIQVESKESVCAISEFGEIKESKTVSPFCSKKGKGAGQISRPHALSCTAEGNVVVADFSNHRIQVFTPQGKLVLSFGKPHLVGPMELL